MPASESLTVFIRDRSRERTLVLSPEGGGRVRLREWDMSAGMDPTERTLEVLEVAAIFERAYDERCTLRPGVAEIRAWLERQRR
jgi:hypothetical protein